MHPHGADRHTLAVAQARTDAGVEHAAQPKVAAQAEREPHVVGDGAAGEHVHRRLHVRHDAHRRAPRIDAAPERESNRDDQLRRAAHEVSAHADDHRAVQREVDRVRDHALPRLGAEQQLRVAGPGRSEKAGLEAQVESVTRDAVGSFERRAAAVGEAQQYADLGAHERAIRSVERGRAGRLGGGGHRGGTEQAGEGEQRSVTPHGGSPPEWSHETRAWKNTRTARPRSSLNRRPPVKTTWLAFPTTPRISANGVTLLFTLKVVPARMFRSTFVLDALTPAAEAVECAIFRPPPP